MAIQLFTLKTTQVFATRVAASLGVSLSDHEEREFKDGEHKCRPLVSVRGNDVYVIQSLYDGPVASVNDKLVRLLFFLAAIRDAGAERVTAVLPYLAYARKDRRTESRDPLTTRYTAQLLEATNIDAVMTLETHNLAAFQNAFRCRADHLDTRRLFVNHMQDRISDRKIVIASPDPGGVKRAQLFQKTVEAALGCPIGAAFMEKRRSRGVVTGTELVGDVDGATVLVVDDLISTGGTMLRAAEACLDRGAEAIYALAAHGLFVGEAPTVVADGRVSSFVVTDTVPAFRLDASLVKKRVEVVSTAPLFAEAIRRCHERRSLVDLIEVQS